MTRYYEINQARLDYNNVAAARGLPQMPLDSVLEQCGATEADFLEHCDAVRQEETPPPLTPDREALATAALRDLVDKREALTRGNGADAKPGNGADAKTGNGADAKTGNGADQLDLDALKLGDQMAFDVLTELCRADPLYIMRDDCFAAIVRLSQNSGRSNAWRVLLASLKGVGVDVPDLKRAIREFVEAVPDPGDGEMRDHDGLTAGFYSEGGALCIDVGKGDNKVSLRLCSEIRAVQAESDADGASWATTAAVTDGRGNRKEVSFSRADAATEPAAVIRKFVDNGLTLHTDDPRHYRMILRAVCWAKVELATRTTESGWNSYDKGESFVFSYPAGSIGVASEKIVWRGDERFARVSQKGTDHAWRENILKLAAGNPVLMAAIGVGISSPAIPFLPRGVEKNTLVALIGPEGKGKSTTLYIVATLWGLGCSTDDPRSFLESLHSTLNNLESVFAAYRHIGLLLDEVKNVDQKAADQFALKFGSGHGKGRLSRNSQSQSWKTWALNGLMSGEKTLGEHADEHALRRNTRDAGEEARVINILIPEDGVFEDLHGCASPKLFAESLAAACVENYGFAGPAFVEYLAANGDHARAKIVENLKAWNVLAGALLGEAHSSQSARIASRLGHMAASAALAAEVLSFPWSADIDTLRSDLADADIAQLKALNHAALAMLQAFARLLKLWIENNGVQVNTQMSGVFAKIRSYYHDAPPAAFVPTGISGPLTPSDPAVATSTLLDPEKENVTFPSPSGTTTVLGWKVMSKITETGPDRLGNTTVKDGKLEFVDFNADLFNARLGLNQTIRRQVLRALRDADFLVPSTKPNEFTRDRSWFGMKIRIIRVKASFFEGKDSS